MTPGRSLEELVAEKTVEERASLPLLDDISLRVPMKVVAVEVVADRLLGRRGVGIALKVGIVRRAPVSDESLDRLIVERAIPRHAFCALPSGLRSDSSFR